MKTSHRYGIITACFIIFFFSAPFLVLFITGMRYDFASHHFIKTGSITVASNPSGVGLYINGKLKAKTPATVRFVDPGDYDIKLQKNGYFDWTKRLNVRAQFTTYLNAGINNVYLFYADPGKIKIADQVTGFYVGRSKIIYIQDTKLFLAQISDPAETQQLSLPAALVAGQSSASQLQIIASNNENYYVIFNGTFYGLFDANNNTFTDITAAINQTGPAINDSSQFQITDSGILYAKNDTKLYKISWNGSPQAQLLSDGVLAFTLEGDQLFLITKNIGTSGNGNDTLVQWQNGSSNTLIPNLPDWISARLYSSSQQQFFIIGDGTLYVVGNGLNRLADYVTDIKFYNNTGKVLFASNNEIDLYDEFDGTTTLVTRSSMQVKQPQAVPNVGYVFFINNNRLQNMELDSRDHQNNYTFANVSDNAKFYVNYNATAIFLLNDGTLQESKIR